MEKKPYIIQAKVVYFGHETRQRSSSNGGGSYDVYQGNVVVADSDGNSVFCDLKSGFNAKVSCTPHVDDTIKIVVGKIDLTMPKGVVEFLDILPVVKKS